MTKSMIRAILLPGEAAQSTFKYRTVGTKVEAYKREIQK